MFKDWKVSLESVFVLLLCALVVWAVFHYYPESTMLHEVAAMAVAGAMAMMRQLIAKAKKDAGQKDDDDKTGGAASTGAAGALFVLLAFGSFALGLSPTACTTNQAKAAAAEQAFGAELDACKVSALALDASKPDKTTAYEDCRARVHARWGIVELRAGDAGGAQ